MTQAREISADSLDIGVLESGHVVIQFGSAIKQMTFTPQQAKDLGLGLIEMGTRAEAISRVQPVGKMSAVLSRVKH
jgi:hypothetical protein